MSSLQWRFGLPTDLTPSVCHSVLLIVNWLSFIRAMCSAHFHFVLVTYWTMYVTLVLCLMVVLRILSFSLTLSILLSIARWLVSSFFTNAFVRDHVWHPYVIAGKTHWLKTFLFKFKGRCLSRKICHTHNRKKSITAVTHATDKTTFLLSHSQEIVQHICSHTRIECRAWNSSWKRGLSREWKSKIAWKTFFRWKKSTSILFF